MQIVSRPFMSVHEQHAAEGGVTDPIMSRVPTRARPREIVVLEE